MKGRRLLASGVVAAVMTVTVTACTATRHHAQPTSSPDVATSPATVNCVVTTGELPTWARAGFSPPTVSMPYVLGANRSIVAILFGNPLRSPPAKDHNNKILWVSPVSEAGSPLKIQARLSGSNRVVTREVEGGPGPSIIDMPAPGCWIFTLTWSGHTDKLAVRYSA